MEALLAFLAAIVALRLAGDLAGRYRIRHTRAFAVWAGALLAYALASAALAWGEAAGWDDRAFRVYYLFGALLTAPLLGAGSLLLVGRKWALPSVLVFTGLAVGIALAVPLTQPVSGTAIPEAQDHLEFVPARLVAVLGNSAGTVAVVAVALLTIRRRPVGNTFLLAGVGVAAAGSAVAGLGVAGTAAFIAVAVLLLYAGFLGSTAQRPRIKGNRVPPPVDAIGRAMRLRPSRLHIRRESPRTK